jgi:hypothetical protein
MWDLKSLPAGRMLWQLGTELPHRLGGNSLLNCWFVSMRHPNDFAFLFSNLMLGGGVGFSVRRCDINELPRVRPSVIITHERTADADVIVPDSREGWVRLLEQVMDAFFLTGRSFSYSTLLIRSKGSPIRGFGGVASGPDVFVAGIERICQIMRRREGQKLRSVDVLDVCNTIGDIVVAGNVRRSAEIAIGDPDDLAYLRAKRWDLGTIPASRAMSNNTVAACTLDDVLPELWAGYEGNGEPYGLYNETLCQEYGRLHQIDPDPSVEGLNPCGEIPLADHECCNLAELFLPRFASFHEFTDASRLLYRLQKHVAAMPYLARDTEEVVHRNMRLGLSVSGVMQDLPRAYEWLDPCYRQLRCHDEDYSQLMGWPRSIRLTTVKPSGTLSLLAGVTPGGHPAYARHLLRRVSVASDSPLVAFAREHGYRVETRLNLDGTPDHRTASVCFPVSYPDGTVVAADTSAIDQLQVVQLLQSQWADNAVSVTVYYRPEELAHIRAYLTQHYNRWFKSLSFLLHTEHGFAQPVLEPLSAEQYVTQTAALVPFSQLVADTTQQVESDCEGGLCPIR